MAIISGKSRNITNISRYFTINIRQIMGYCHFNTWLQLVVSEGMEIYKWQQSDFSQFIQARIKKIFKKSIDYFFLKRYKFCHKAKTS